MLNAFDTLIMVVDVRSGVLFDTFDAFYLELCCIGEFVIAPIVTEVFILMVASEDCQFVHC